MGLGAGPGTYGLQGLLLASLTKKQLRTRLAEFAYFTRAMPNLLGAWQADENS
jgi:hypothetical protein